MNQFPACNHKFPPDSRKLLFILNMSNDSMPAVFTYVMQHDVMRFAKVAVRVWGCQMDFDHPEVTAKAGIEALRAFLCSIGMPKNFAELGAKEEDIPVLVDTLCGGDRGGSISGFVTLTAEDCARIYQLMVF